MRIPDHEQTPYTTHLTQPLYMLPTKDAKGYLRANTRLRTHLSLNLILFPIGNLGSRRPATYNSAALLPLHATPHPDLLVKDEAPQHCHPALMLRQRGIKLLCHLMQLRQPRPGDGGEIVMFIVQADVVREEIQRAVVAKRLGDGDVVRRITGRRGDRLVHVVLGDEVARRGMQRAGEERGEEEVQQRIDAKVAREEVDQHVVEGQLDREVDPVHPGKGHAVDGHGPDGVEEDLEGAEEGLAEDRVEEDSFEGGGQVRVESIDAEGLVVGKVVWLGEVSLSASHSSGQVSSTYPE